MSKKNRLITGSNFRDFDWNKAKLFYHIAKCGSFSKAARLADTDQPVLTRQIQSLEAQVGCPLLIRKSGLGVSLTRKGEELLERIAPFFLEMKGFCGNRYVEIGDEKKRKIRIATSYALGDYLIGNLILDCAKENPHLVFELVCDDDFIDIILGDIDIAIQSIDPHNPEQKTKGAQQEHLFTLQKKLYASSDYIKKHGEPKTVDDLKNHRLIAFPFLEEIPSSYQNFNWLLTLGMPEGECHTPVYTSNVTASLVEAAKKGIGIIESYEEYDVIKNSQLVNVLPQVKDQPYKMSFVYPSYLKEDEDIVSIKKYLMSKLKD